MRSTLMEKQSRCAEANKVLQAIADHGRRFFYNPTCDKVASLAVDARGRVWYVDEYGDRPIYTHYQGRWSEFSGGGTLLRLVKALQQYVLTGVPIDYGYFGPWPQTLCDGDLWAYGEDMDLVRAKVFRTLAVRRPLRRPAI